MYIDAKNTSNTQMGPTTMHCPHCGKNSTFDLCHYGNDVSCSSSNSSPKHAVGIRRCPNLNCRALVFVVFNMKTRKVIQAYPPERLDFDSSNIPPDIVENVEQAITCHANECYIAAAIMIRRSVEFLCDDQGATGKVLKQRLEALGKKIVIPPDLMDNLDVLRLFGNDANHVEARDFSDIGKEHVEAAMEFLKEVLKATYQYKGMIERLKALRKSPDQPSA